MIKKKISIISAKCDSCKKNLLKEVGGIENYEYGMLIPHFGYGSMYDMVDKYFEISICEKCWEKCLNSIGLDPKNYVG